MKIAHIFAANEFESRGIKFIESARENNIKIEEYLMKKDENYFRFVLRIINSIIRSDNKIIHAHRISGFLPAIFVKLLRPKIKIIYDKHDIHDYDFIFDRLMLFADYVIVCSELHLKQVKKFKKESIILQNYSNFKRSSEKIIKQIRKELKIGGNETLVLFQGSIVPSYGLDMLLKSVPLLNKNVKIGVIGWIKDEKYWNEIKYKFGGIVKYFGSKKYKEMQDYNSAADIGVVLFQKSKLTIFGNPAKLFEFIACKVPLVVTDINCVSKYIKEYKNGIVIKNTNELATAINKLSNKRIALEYAKRSPNLVWEDCFKKYLEIVSKLYKD